MPPSTLSPNDAVCELLRRVEITGKARYHAARRMAAHGWFSQWTLALLAVGQIVISLASAVDVRTNFCPSYIGFASVFFGVLVLAYSLLLGMTNFSSRGVKLHTCGLELGRLARELTLLCRTGTGTKDAYDVAYERYYDILDKHENHTRTDYLVAHYEYYDAEAAQLTFGSRDWIIERLRLLGVRLKLYFFHLLQFSHYVLSVTLISVWIYFLVGPAYG